MLKRITMDNLITIKDYADNHNITVQAVHQQIKDGKLFCIEFLGVKAIDLKQTEKLQKKLMKEGNKRKDIYKPQYHTKCVDLWDKFYKGRFGASPLFQNKEFANLKKLIAYFEKQKEGSSVATFEYIIKNWDSLDKFIRESYSISVLYSNLNKVIATFRGKQETNIDNIEKFW